MNTTWQFNACAKTGAITATEPDGTRHTVTRGDMNTVAGHALLNAMTRDLTRPSTDLSDAVFALQSAWPYVNSWCTIDAKRNQIRAVLQKHGDFEDLAHVQRSVKEAEPVAYGIFADIPGEGWVLQFPNYATRADAERMAGVFVEGTRIEVRPLYA